MGHDARPATSPEAWWPSPGPLEFNGGSGRFSVSARDKKPRLSGASVAGWGTPDPSVVGRRVSYDARCHRSPSIKAEAAIPGSLIGVQTARLFPAAWRKSRRALGPKSWSSDSDLPRQEFALNLSAKRRLCNTVGKRFIDGTARCCAVSIARSRAAATTNFARSNQSLALRFLFAGAKSFALSMSACLPPLSAGD